MSVCQASSRARLSASHSVLTGYYGSILIPILLIRKQFRNLKSHSKQQCLFMSPKFECKTRIFNTVPCYQILYIPQNSDIVYSSTIQHEDVRTGKRSPFKYFPTCIRRQLYGAETIGVRSCAIISFSTSENIENGLGKIQKTDHFEGSPVLGQSNVPVRLSIWLWGCIVSKHPFLRSG